MKQWYESLFENYGKKYDNENSHRAQLVSVISSKKKLVLISR